MKKTLITIAVMVLFAVAVIGAGILAEPSSGLHTIEPSSPCPVTGCASGECHGFDNVPGSDGVHEMICPEAGCASTECHAWDSLIGRYHQASDASLNVWILMPVVLLVALIAMMRVLSKKDTPGQARNIGSKKGGTHE